MHKIYTIILALMILNTVYAKDRVYRTPLSIKQDTVWIEQLEDNIDRLKVHIRAAAPNVSQGYKDCPCSWAMVLNYVDSLNYIGLSLSWHNTTFGNFDDIRYVCAEAYIMNEGEKKIISQKQLERGVNLYKGFNSIVLNTFEGKTVISVGSNQLTQVAELNLSPDSIYNCGFITNTPLKLSRFQTKTELREPLIVADYDMESLKSYFAQSNDPIEGFWTYLDRNNDIRYALPGGQYDLAIVKSNDTYDILYLGGATVCPNEWQIFQHKGTLKPTIFENHFDLTWLDVRRHVVSSENNASLTQGAILTLNFPLLKSSMRFKKVL